MAIRVEEDEVDELSRLLQDPCRNHRSDIWLWLWLYQYNEAEFDTATCNGSTMRETLARFLRRRTTLLQRINSEKDRFLVPNQYLQWIDGQERQFLWLLNRIEAITDLRPPHGLPRGLVHLTGKNLLTAMLDLWDIDIARKVDEIDHLRVDWLEHRAQDRDFEWFEDRKDGTKRCRCAWEWLEKNDKSIFRGRLAIGNYNELLIYFDKAAHGRNERKVIVQKIKNRWNRKQFDERAADKKQCNVMLSKKVILQLDQLTEKHGLKRAQILELLITAEAEAGKCLAKIENPLFS